MAGSTNIHQQDPRAARSSLTRGLRRTSHVVAVTGGAAAMVVLSATTSAAAPTCSDSTIIDVEVHGQHIIGDYLTGLGHKALEWPPAGQVGAAIGSDGPAVVGGPGPGFHFLRGIAPGASFCVLQASSPGVHG